MGEERGIHVREIEDIRVIVISCDSEKDYKIMMGLFEDINNLEKEGEP